MKRSTSAFTVIELMLAICIIALLASLLSPVLTKARKRAESVGCAANLKKLFVGISAAANDNDNKYPYIEPWKTKELYDPEDGALRLGEALAPYGITASDLKCPADIKRGKESYFEKEGTSYEWSPYVDGELTSATKIYGRRNNTVYTPKLSRTKLVRDFYPGHNNGANILFADGSTRIR